MSYPSNVLTSLANGEYLGSQSLTSLQSLLLHYQALTSKLSFCIYDLIPNEYVYGLIFCKSFDIP